MIANYEEIPENQLDDKETDRRPKTSMELTENELNKFVKVQMPICRACHIGAFK